jgi:hypothetical protein
MPVRPGPSARALIAAPPLHCPCHVTTHIPQGIAYPGGHFLEPVSEGGDPARRTSAIASCPVKNVVFSRTAKKARRQGLPYSPIKPQQRSQQTGNGPVSAARSL